MEGNKIIIPQFDVTEKNFDKWIETFELYYHIRLWGGSLEKNEGGLPIKMKGAFDKDDIRKGISSQKYKMYGSTSNNISDFYVSYNDTFK